jgi:hypothetical protein
MRDRCKISKFVFRLLAYYCLVVMTIAYLRINFGKGFEK